MVFISEILCTQDAVEEFIALAAGMGATSIRRDLYANQVPILMCWSEVDVILRFVRYKGESSYKDIAGFYKISMDELEEVKHQTFLII
jgi:hypothetical protein